MTLYILKIAAFLGKSFKQKLLADLSFNVRYAQKVFLWNDPLNLKFVLPR
jgi:hypothetical protein